MQVNLSGLLLNSQSGQGTAKLPLAPKPLPAPESVRKPAPSSVSTGGLDFVRSALESALAERGITSNSAGVSQLFNANKGAEESVDVIIGQLKNALSKGLASVDQLKQITERIFAEAFQRFAQAGPTTQDALVDAQRRVDQVLARSVEAPAVVRSAERLVFDSAQQTSLSIRTSEGDVVRLSLSNRESFDVSRAAEARPGRRTEEINVLLSSSQRISVSISGDLNEDELQAVQDLIDQAEVLADEFFQGNTQSAFEIAQGLQLDQDQLAAFDLRLRSVTQVGYEQLSDRPRAIDPSVQGFVGPRESVNVEPALVPKPLNLQKPNEVRDARSENDIEQAESQDDALLSLFGSLEQLFQTLTDFVNQVVDALGLRPNQQSAAEFSNADRFEVFAAIVSLLAPSDEARNKAVPELVRLSPNFFEPQQASVSQEI